MAKRVSLNASQTTTAAGAELIALCQTVTQDGHLSDDEIGGLRQWLVDHEDSDLPALAFLRETLTNILADGKVTPEERDELYRAIEKVLPPDIRASVKGTRVAAAKVAQAEARQRNRRVDSYDFMIAGVHYDGRADVIRAFARDGDIAYLVREPGNQFSKHAVEVRLSNGMQAGYVPDDLARDVAPLLDTGHRQDTNIKKVLRGGRAPIPVIESYVFLPESDAEGTIAPHEVPPGVRPIPGSFSVPADPPREPWQGHRATVTLTIAAPPEQPPSLARRIDTFFRRLFGRQ